MRVRLIDVAKVIRSKNAGPFELTLDIILKDEEIFQKIKEARIITPELISHMYHTSIDDILGIIYFDPAYAVKITLKRRIPSGSFGETDIYGAQQHAPLAAMEFELRV